jgi:hypothetical protein
VAATSPCLSLVGVFTHRYSRAPKGLARWNAGMRVLKIPLSLELLLGAIC